ncbi:MAG: hypothetical protein LAP85_29425 [Acidobacteriia bacterium]|nr:hypothetical protein [Terriglobia bacterium]
MQVFELAQVAKIAGISRFRLKGWILGKTRLTLTPSVRSRKGRYFSAEDAFKVSVAAALDRAGLAKGAIAEILPLIPSTLASRLFVQRGGERWSVTETPGVGELRIELNLGDVIARLK